MRAPNVTLDIYIAPNAPPAAPDTAGATGCLIPNFRPGQEANEGSRTFLWDHLLEVPLDTDIRDTYPGAPTQQIFIPHTIVPGLGQTYLVVFVEKVTHFHTPRGKPFKRVYLKRGSYTEPTVPLTIREVDGTPSYSTVEVLEVDQADGFTLSEPAPGQIRLDVDMATLAAALSPSLPDTEPSFVGARVYNSASQVIASGSFTSVEFNGEHFDVGGFHDNATNNSRFTIPVGKAGYYRVTAKVCWEDFDGFVQAQLIENGATVLTLDAGTNTTSGYFHSFFVNAIKYIDEGSYIEFQVYQETGTDKEIYGGTAMNYFEIEYLGA